MANEKTLIDMIREAAGAQPMAIYQGIVKSVDDGETCTVTFGSLDVSDIRLRASLADVDKQILLTPKVGSAVVVGSLSGDYTQMAVLQMDEVDSIKIGSSDDACKIELNGGELGGLVKIEELTSKLNELVEKFNSFVTGYNTHKHVESLGGTTLPPASQAQQANQFNKSDYEDENIMH